MKKLTIFFIFLIIIVALAAGVYIKVTSENSTYTKSQQLKEEEEIKNKAEEAKKEEERLIKEKELEEAARIKKESESYITLAPEEVYIPILMYHSISDSDPKNNLMVPVAQFNEQMSWLNKEGFTPMLMDDVVKALKTGKVPKKPVAITFDDGYADNYTDGFKALVNNNMKATFFIITDNTDVNSWYMNSTMLKEMASKGMGIENHTSKHLELNKLSRTDKIAIIKDGRDALKAKVGVDSKYVCYPVGRYDDETISVERELGIQGAVTTNGGFANIKNGEFEMKRVRMSPMDINSFKDIFKSFMVAQ